MNDEAHKKVLPFHDSKFAEHLLGKFDKPYFPVTQKVIPTIRNNPETQKRRRQMGHKYVGLKIFRKKKNIYI